MRPRPQSWPSIRPHRPMPSGKFEISVSTVMTSFGTSGSAHAGGPVGVLVALGHVPPLALLDHELARAAAQRGGVHLAREQQVQLLQQRLLRPRAEDEA